MLISLIFSKPVVSELVKPVVSDQPDSLDSLCNAVSLLSTNCMCHKNGKFCMCENPELKSQELDSDQISAMLNEFNQPKLKDLKIVLTEKYNDDLLLHKCVYKIGDYMKQQTDINPRMREITIDWLVEVQNKFKLKFQTLELTVKIMDRFLEKRGVLRNKLQLLACSAMLIASKYEEIFPPEVNDFVSISDKAFTREQLCAMEQIIVKELQFKMVTSITSQFADFYIEFFIELYPQLKDLHKRFKNIVYYLIKLTLQDYSFVQVDTKILAASAVYIVLNNLECFTPETNNIWNSEIETFCGLKFNDIKLCIDKLLQYVNDPKSFNYTKYRAVRKENRNMPVLFK